MEVTLVEKDGKKLIKLVFSKDSQSRNFIVSTRSKRVIAPHFERKWEQGWYLFPGKYIRGFFYGTRRCPIKHVEIGVINITSEGNIEEKLISRFSIEYELNSWYNRPLPQEWKWLVDVEGVSDVVKLCDFGEIGINNVKEEDF